MSTDTTIRADERGLWHLAPDGEALFGFAWSEIFSVSGSKLDLIESECIILSFDDEHGEFIELTDRTPGFAEAVVAISRYLPGIASDWFTRIAKLSIAAEPLTVWRKA